MTTVPGSQDHAVGRPLAAPRSVLPSKWACPTVTDSPSTGDGVVNPARPVSRWLTAASNAPASVSPRQIVVFDGGGGLAGQAPARRVQV